MRDRPQPVSFLVLSFTLFLAGLASAWAVMTLTSFHLNPHRANTADSRRSDVIVVLAGDSERTLYAASLAEQGAAARTLSTLLDPGCLQAGRSTEECGTGVRNTVDEALVMRRILSQEQVRRVAVVTSRYHVARAASVFGILFAGSGIQLDVVAPPLTKPLSEELRVQELVKFVPSIMAATLARFTPALYQWLMHYYPAAANQCAGTLPQDGRRLL
ncbi:MAG: hypothetical protein C4293_02885 [Nitrospiraceae bacterium]